METYILVSNFFKGSGKVKKLLYPKNYVLLIGLLTIIISLIYLIFFHGFDTSIAYVLYLIMTYFFIIICIRIYNIVKSKMNKFIDNNKHLSKYKNDHKLKYKISLFTSLILNVVYAMFKLLSGIVFKSFWFISFALYYFLLIILRSNIVKEELNDNTNLKDEFMEYRKTGIILLFTNVILTIIILIIVNQKIMSIYPDWMAITVAVYTFYLLFNSIYNLIKYHKYKSPLISSSKVINVITSLVSLISLEIILIPTFGSNETEFFEIMIMATGGGIALIIIIISFYMIIKSTEWLNQER